VVNMVNKPKPLDVLNKSLKSPVIVRIRGGREFRGTLEGYDLHMNLVLSNAEELNTDTSTNSLMGEILVRGDNVVYISPTVQKETEKGVGKSKSEEAGEKETW
jgi:small nuclear ribonucleoprotein